MGRPVVHWELWSENPDKVAKFYPDGRVLGMWKQEK